MMNRVNRIAISTKQVQGNPSSFPIPMAPWLVFHQSPGSWPQKIRFNVHQFPGAPLSAVKSLGIQTSSVDMVMGQNPVALVNINLNGCSSTQSYGTIGFDPWPSHCQVTNLIRRKQNHDLSHGKSATMFHGISGNWSMSNMKKTMPWACLKIPI